MTRPAALVFDLDGTLVDSRRDLATAINLTRNDYGLPPHPVERVVAMVGEGARKLVERAFAGDLPAERVDEALGRYLSHYGDVLFDTTVPYPGVPEMLAALAPAFPLALLSNKGETFSRRLLEHLGIARCFREVLGGDSLPSRKPDPSGLRLLAERLGVPIESLVLVGDTRVDAETAANAGCRFALVTWGTPRPQDEGTPADLVAGTPAELAAALSGS